MKRAKRRMCQAAAVAVTAGVLATVTGACHRRSFPGRTNVVLIIVDTLRADHLHCYGYPRPTSPTIDGLAAGGVLFEQATANCSWTRPSIGSLLTGV